MASIRTWHQLDETVIDLHDGLVTLKFSEAVELVAWDEQQEPMVAVTLKSRDAHAVLVVVPRSAVQVVTGFDPAARTGGAA